MADRFRQYCRNRRASRLRPDPIPDARNLTDSAQQPAAVHKGTMLLLLNLAP